MPFVLRIASYVLSSVLLLALLTWLTGRVVSDRYLWSQFILWAPTPLALLAAVIGLINATVRAQGWRIRSEAGLWSGVLIALLTYFVQFEHRLLSRPVNDPEGLMIVHWNWWPAEGDEGKDFFAPIEAIEPDIVILSRTYQMPWRSEARKRFGDDVYLAGVHPFGVISRVPIVEVQPMVSRDGITLVVFTFDTAGQFARSLAVHAVDLPSDLRGVRREVALTLLDSLDDRDPPPADVMLGDFNMTRGASLRMLTEGMDHAFRQSGHGWSGTFYRTWPFYHIDHIFVRKPFRATRYDIIDPGVSRHRLQRVWIERGVRDEE